MPEMVASAGIPVHARAVSRGVSHGGSTKGRPSSVRRGRSRLEAGGPEALETDARSCLIAVKGTMLSRLMDPTLVAHYREMARYNRWMNERLYALAGQLSDEERKRPMGAFFGSIHGTFNHLLLADRVWLARFGAGERPAVKSLADILFDDFDALRRERAITDGVMEAYVASLDAQKLGETLAYKTSKGAPMSHALWIALSHFFNHQTHHRGQATTLFMQLGHDPGVTDALVLLLTPADAR
jgi:uncharacterized damage-inducible protein DinB